MAKNTFNDFDTTASNNTDIAGIDIQGTAAVMNFDNALRTLMALLRSGVPGLTLANVLTKTQTWAKGADVASATALTLGTDGNYFDITGTTSITSITTIGAGTVVKLHFDGILTLTHHATDLILPGGANITTAAGDEAEFVEYATGDWRCTNYQKAIGSLGVAWEHIETQTLSAASAATFTGLSAFRMLRATLFTTVSVDGEIVYAQTSVSGVFFTTITGYNNQAINGFSTTVNTANSDGMKITSALGNAGNEAACAVAHFFEFNQAKVCFYTSDTHCLNSATTAVKTLLGGLRSDASARDGIRFIPGSGTISGIITLEGIRG